LLRELEPQLAAACRAMRRARRVHVKASGATQRSDGSVAVAASPRPFG
jgi:hypothetical protein